MRPEKSASGLVIRPRAGCLCCAPERIGFASEQIGTVAPVQAEAASGYWIMPPLANAHDHARGVRPTSLGAFDLPLEMWLAVMTGAPVADPWLVVAKMRLAGRRFQAAAPS
ncbi:MAG TPA: hypothetical protein VGN83_09745 [Falsiroseomonas sp.]|jgi:cytosine/adenosine deaminase-related metal-dependent hydrolase|nr:hypothetical protein [Falsiroseomonas sp.]